METLGTLVLLLLCLSASAVSGIGSKDTVLTAAPGSNIIIPSCHPVSNLTMVTLMWRKVNVDGGTSPVPSTERIQVLYGHELQIQGVTPGDDGIYQCSWSSHPFPAPNNTVYSRYRLLVTSGPENVSLSIGRATPLSNGTLIVYRDSSVSFNCSGSSFPSQHLNLSFTGGSSSNVSLASGSGSWLSHTIENIQPGSQGLYSCRAHNNVSDRMVQKNHQLLVYYAPDRHPDCSWAPAADASHALFNCSWFGAYPTPTLRWVEDQGDQGAHWKGHVFVTDTRDSLSLSLNRSLLSEGQTLRCMAKGFDPSGKEKSCSLTLKPPYPRGEPLVTALEGTSVTLTCTEDASIPPANTTWRKGLQQDAITPGSKYALTEEGPALKLTIHNLTKEDEGVFFCRSENPLDLRELEVGLTVRAPSAFTGAIVGIIIAALVVGLTFIVAKSLYSCRHRICLGNSLWPLLPMHEKSQMHATYLLPHSFSAFTVITHCSCNVAPEN
ncbi:LOW QUALITY PROTEIN: V-set and immunoglobulin domain-containing protein 10 [Pleuronectes platessa]|uniref:LOW QUALITY PROTEIN: V-set and immunoglobulin domain-containing protein 10 n=1 Tax=Pleuronectes platessa TaxID=8262 RepID=UPI00232A1EF6|nr:LOW QUALITY PROTEIN: V-set and immunoglobulin domain-containing protein 10 [Pleuronectes platessa]